MKLKKIINSGNNAGYDIVFIFACTSGGNKSIQAAAFNIQLRHPFAVEPEDEFKWNCK